MNVHYCVLFSSRVRVRIRVRIRLTVWLVSGYCTTFDCHFHNASQPQRAADSGCGASSASEERTTLR